MDLKDITLGLLADSRKERERAKAARTKRGRRTAPKHPTIEAPGQAPEAIIDPWHHTAVVLLTTHTTCRSCDTIMIGCEPHLYLEKYRGTPGKSTYCRRLERITNYSGKWSELYTTLPKRTEPRLVEVDACPWCFGLQADDTGLHYTKPAPTQLELFQ